MTFVELERLVAIGLLKIEPPGHEEFEGLLRGGRARLADARNEELSPESRFELGYGAAHAFALAALRRCGYRSDRRHVVFQCLPHTLGASSATWRLLAKCHERRNLAEYEGRAEIDAKLLEGLIQAAEQLLDCLQELPPPGK